MDTTSSSCRIQINSEGDIRWEEVTQFPFTLGRGEKADVKILSPGISRIHLKVEVRGSELWIQDLESSNGTIVANKKIPANKLVPYRAGDFIKLGIYEGTLVLNLLQKAPEIPPAPVYEKTVVDPSFQVPLPPPPIGHNAQRSLAELTAPSVPVQESEKTLSEAKSAAHKIRVQAETEASKLLQEAKIKVLGELSTVHEEADKIIRIANETALRTTALAEAQSAASREAVQDAVMQLHLDAEKHSQTIRSAAKDKGEAIVSEYQAKGEKFVSEARLSAMVTKSEAQKEADSLIGQAHQKIMEMKATAEQTLRLATKEQKEKAELIINEAQAESDRILQDARKASSEIRRNIDKELSEIRAKGELEAAKVVEEGKVVAQEILKTANQEAKAVLQGAQEEGDLQKEKILKIAFIESDKIKEGSAEDARVTSASIFEKAREENTRLAAENKDLIDKILTHQAEYQDLSELCFKLNKKSLEVKTDHEALLSKLASEKGLANADLAQIISKVEDSKSLLELKFKEIESANADLRKIAESIDEKVSSQKLLEKDHEELLSSLVKLQKDIAETKMQSDAEMVKRKADQAQELSSLKQTEAGKIRSFKLAEEAKILAARKAHVVEISKALEMYLVPRITENFKINELPKSFGDFYGEISEIVRRVFDAEFSGTGSGAQSGVPTHGQNIAPIYKRKKRDTLVVLGSSLFIICLIIITIYRNNDGVERKPASQAYADRLADERASKPRFNPELNDEYKDSYSDNVLYTKNYVGFKLKTEIQAKWIRELNKFFINELSLSENSIVRFSSIEVKLVSKLRDLRALVHVERQTEDLEKLYKLERETLPELKSITGNEENYRLFRDYEKKFFQRNRASLD